MTRLRGGWAIVLAIGLLGAAFAAAWSVDGIRWRAEVVAMKASGRLVDVTWPHLLAMIRPGSAFFLEELRETGNPYASIRNPYISDADQRIGEQLFAARCASCHGTEGKGGGTAPALVGRTLKVGDSDWSAFRSVAEGIPERGMPSFQMPEREAWQIVGYVQSLRSDTAEFATKPVFEHASTTTVPSARIEQAASEPNNWLTYSGTYRSWRYTSLDQITIKNVAELKLAWALQLGGYAEYIETSPVVVDGVMYLTAPPSDVVAVEAASGQVLWRYTRAVPSGLHLCCGNVNRGVAILDDHVFVGSIDGHLIALDARSGKVVWDVLVADYKDGYSITAAPLAVRDKIVVGIGGGDYGTRGFLDAYDTAGKRLWRFYTVPGPGQFGSDTWTGESWRAGGGPTWLTGSFDSDRGLLYWGVGNPGPNFNGDVRLGDNLFTNSVIALDVETGKLVWHFQFTPHDQHDWDANQIPVLVDSDYEGERRSLLLWANRNGFYYVLDRISGRFLHAKAFVTQNWAEGLDAAGRPILTVNAEPSSRGTLTWPGLSGGANWWSPSYNPGTRLIYVPFADAPKVIFKNAEFEGRDLRSGRQFLGSVSVHTGDPLRAGIRALDSLTGNTVWEYARPQPRVDRGYIGGTLTTAGGLVFFGDLSHFLALDAVDGRTLWRVNLGGSINASPIGFASTGRQMIAIPAGNSLYVFAL